jgi:uncharacterized membrane protein
MTWGHAHAWLILVAILLLAGFVRHFFNLRHRGRNAWWIPATTAIGLAVLALLIQPNNTVLQGKASAGPSVPFARVQSIVEQRCVPCHSANPTQPGFSSAPLGIRLDTREEIEAQASAIEQQAVDTKAMPLGNVTKMTQAERDTLARWLASR